MRSAEAEVIDGRGMRSPDELSACGRAQDEHVSTNLERNWAGSEAEIRSLEPERVGVVDMTSGRSRAHDGRCPLSVPSNDVDICTKSNAITAWTPFGVLARQSDSTDQVSWQGGSGVRPKLLVNELERDRCPRDRLEPETFHLRRKTPNGKWSAGFCEETLHAVLRKNLQAAEVRRNDAAGAKQRQFAVFRGVQGKVRACPSLSGRSDCPEEDEKHR